MSEYVDLVWVKEASGSGVFEAPAWSILHEDIVTVNIPGMCGGFRERHVKSFVTVSKESDEYNFIKAINGGQIDKVKALYHKAEVAE